MSPRSRVSSLVVSLLALTSTASATGAACEPPVLALETAPVAGLPLRIALDVTGADGGIALLARRPGSRWAQVVALAAPGEGFELELPRGCEGLELELWAVGTTAGARWQSSVESVTVGQVDLAGFDPSVDRFAITGTSLGYSGLAANVTCASSSAFVNSELRFDTSQPVELSSVQLNPACVRIIDVTTGASPAGTFLLDPGDASVLIFRPQLSFGPLGTPSFAFGQGATYQIQIAGQAAGSSPPYLLSVTGAPMSTRLLCSVTTQGVLDPVPGPPSVTLTPAGGTTGVPLDATIVMSFDDIMNLATLVVPATGLAPFITIQDGSGAPLAGSFQFSVDQNANTTRVEFLPAQPFAPGETITVDLPAAILDLVGNPLANAGSYAFTTAP